MTAWATDTVIAVSLLILAVLALRGPVSRRFGAHAAYALWAAPLLRLVIPPVDLLPHLFPQTAPVDMWIVISDGGPSAAPVESPFPWLLAIWAAGALAYLAVQLVRHHRFVAKARKGARDLGRAGPARIVASPAIAGPLATGLVDRLILVPDDFDARFAPRERELALLHEQLHHQRLDLWAAAASLVLAAALWFNPLVHAAMAAFRRDMEASCDASVLARTGRDARADYAETLLRSACPSVPRSLCALTSIDDLKGRLTMLNQSMTGLRRAGGLLLAASVAAVGLTLAGPAASADQQERAAPPPPPAPPAPPVAPPAPPAPPAPIKGERTLIRVVDTDTKDTAGRPGEPVQKQVRIVEIHGDDGKEMQWKSADGTIDKVNCAGSPTEVNSSTEADGKKQNAKIFICAKGGETRAEQVKHLEEAVARLKGNTDMDAAIRADLVAKLEAKVAELKARP